MRARSACSGPCCCTHRPLSVCPPLYPLFCVCVCLCACVCVRACESECPLAIEIAIACLPCRPAGPPCLQTLVHAPPCAPSGPALHASMGIVTPDAPTPPRAYKETAEARKGRQATGRASTCRVRRQRARRCRWCATWGLAERARLEAQLLHRLSVAARWVVEGGADRQASCGCERWSPAWRTSRPGCVQGASQQAARSSPAAAAAAAHVFCMTRRRPRRNSWLLVLLKRCGEMKGRRWVSGRGRGRALPRARRVQTRRPATTASRAARSQGRTLCTCPGRSYTTLPVPVTLKRLLYALRAE